MKIKFILIFILVVSLGFHVPSDAYAADGDVTSTEEINDSTANGPELGNTHNFGISIANIGDLDGDGVNDLAVGAHGDDDGGTNRGAIHILFMNTDGSVDSTEVINDSTANGPTLTDNDYWGRSIANIGDLDGDGVNDIAVGATSDDTDETGNASGGINRGAVHILFMNTDGSIDSTVVINDSTANGPGLSNHDKFGMSIANIGDLDGDGVNDLAVGADGDDTGGNNRGTVYILFMNTDGSIDSIEEINDSTPNGPELEGYDMFGSSIADIGDLNNDGVNDIIVGAIGADCVSCVGNNSGEVHIMFMNTDGSVDSTVEINDST
ncbi:MAG TPA: integrin alpha, partial [Nitrosopumilus sp.]|nr:integrin alpha [Nitrosopumilus sp.]